MNCPFCGASMEPGRLETNAVLHFGLHWPASLHFLPDDAFAKRRVSTQLARREGWYCAACGRIVGIFDAK